MSESRVSERIRELYQTREAIGDTEKVKKLLNFAVDRSLVKVPYSLQAKSDIKKAMEEAIKAVEGPESFVSVETAAAQQKILSALDDQLDLLTARSGATIRRSALELVDLSLEGVRLQNPIAWQGISSVEITSGKHDFSKLHQQVEEIFKKSGLGDRQFRLELRQAQRASWDVLGAKHSSSHLFYSLVAPGGSKAFDFSMTAPSGGNLFAQSSLGFTGKFAPSQSLYAAKSAYMPSIIKGEKGLVGSGITDYFGIQKHSLNRFFDRIQEVTSQGGGFDELRQLSRTWGAEIQSFGMELGPSVALGGASPLAKQAIEGRMRRASLEANHAILFAPDPFSTTQYTSGEVAQAMVNTGYYPGGSANVMAKGGGYSANIQYAYGKAVGAVPLYKEPLKFLKDVSPVPTSSRIKVGKTKTGIRRSGTIDLYGFGEAGKNIPSNNFIVTFIEPEAQIGRLGNTPLKAYQVFGEGSSMVRQSLLEKGAMDSVSLRSIHLTSINAAGNKAKVSEAVNKVLREGKGILPPDSLLGFSPTGELEQIPSSKFETHAAVGVTPGAAEGSFSITAQTYTRGAIREGGQIIPHHYSSRMISEANIIKGIGSVVEDTGFFRTLGEQAGSIRSLSEIAIRPEKALSGAQARLLMSGALRLGAGIEAEQGAGDVYNKLKQIANMSNSALAEEVSKQAGSTFGEQMVGFINKELEGHQALEQFKKTHLPNILAPYTEWGNTRWGEMDEINRFWTQMGGSLPENVARGATTPITSVIGARPSLTPELAGVGAKGTLEPRFFDIFRLNEMKHTQNELVNRMTNFAAPMAELTTTIKGLRGSLELGGMESITLEKALSPEGSSLWGYGAGVNVTLPEQFAGTGVARSIYVPGGLETHLMGQFTPATGSPKAKMLRATYENFFENVQLASQSMGDQVKEFQKAVQTFEKDLLNNLATLYSGLPGGGAHGALRNRVEGSLALPNLALGQLGLLDQAEMLSPLRSQMNSQIAKMEEVLKANNSTWGDVKILSKQAIHKMYTDAANTARQAGNGALANVYSAEKQALLAGEVTMTRQVLEGENLVSKAEPIMGLAWRQPGIGAHSAAPAFLMADLSVGSEVQSYVRSVQTKIEDASISLLDHSGMVKGAAKKLDITSGLMQMLNYDFDGDNLILSSIGQHDAAEELRTMMRSESRSAHAMRYTAMKSLASTHLQGAGKLLQEGTPLIDWVTKITTEAEATTAVKNIVPRVSNTFTELKYAIATHEGKGLTTKARRDLFRIFEAAEQVPISGKRFADAPEAVMNILGNITQLSDSLEKGVGDRKRAVGTFLESIFGTSAESYGVQIGKDLKEVIDFRQMGGDLLQVMNDYAQDTGRKNHYTFFRKKFEEAGETFYRAARENADQVIANLEKYSAIPELGERIKKAMPMGREMARGGAQAITEGIEGAAKAAAEKLPTKGLAGIAALTAGAVLMAGVTSFTLGPSFAAGSGGRHRVVEDMSDFQTELAPRAPFLHSAGIDTPRSYLQPGGFNVQIDMANGAYNPGAVGALHGVLQASMPFSHGQVQVTDMRGSIDKSVIAKIRDEII